MSRFSRRHLFFACLLALCSLALSGIMFANHSWGSYHWARTSNPFTLKVGDNVSSAWDSYLDTTIADWSASTVLDLAKVAGGAKPRNCRPNTGRVEVCTASYGNTGWLGIASISITGGTHITAATVKNNDTYFNTATYNTPAWRNMVMCQEVGHALGLDHQDTNFDNPNLGTCMDYTNDPTTNQHPNAHDYAQLESIYAHLDSTTTVGQTVSNQPPAMSSIDMEGPGQWGRLIHQSADGRISTYMQDFGGGNKIITQVIWALPRDKAQQ